MKITYLLTGLAVMGLCIGMICASLSEVTETTQTRHDSIQQVMQELQELRR